MKLLSKTLLITIIIVTAASKANAYDCVVDGIYYTRLSNTEVEVEDVHSNISGGLIVPKTITYSGRTFNVISIKENAFHNKTNLTSVTISNGVTSIGNYAFSGCYNLEAVTMPNSITSIGNSAFQGCSHLASAAIPNSITSISSGMFDGCIGLTSVSIGNRVTSIEGGAFYGCQSLISISIPESVTSIGNMAFYGCSGLKKAEFASIEHLCNISFSGTDYPLSSNPLVNAHNLYINGEEVTTITIPNSVTTICNSTFACCTGLTSVNIPSSVTSIEGYAFYGCSGLTSMTVPQSVTYIRESAFSHCSGMTSVSILGTISNIADAVFGDCYRLTSIVLPEGVTNIGTSAFYGCSSLLHINIPNSVESINSYAFYNCKNLSNIIIPDGVTSIGIMAFYGCSELTSATIGSGVIGNSAFKTCTNLSDVFIGENVTSIESQVFSGCTNLANIYCYAEIPPLANSDTFDSEHYTWAELHAPIDYITLYQNAYCWKDFSYITAIGEITPTPKCATPVLSYRNGKVYCICETEDVKYVYSITPTATSGESNDGVILLGTQFTVSVRATREGYSDSEASVITINMADVGDLNGDGTISIADVTGLVNVILGK